MEDQPLDELLTEYAVTGKEWMINELPGLLLVLIVFFVLFRVSSLLFRKLRTNLYNQAEKSEKMDTDEAVKRINRASSKSHA